ncbi:DNA-directed RNA polymerase subunit rpo7 [Squirrelpox virus]|uniref:DNA-directed RNA polymerase 7 kDa subunit n=1 Tax=Squirrelpox virus TaxID=240426 RepID=U3UB97_9POXV|nr:DNA-directed RNA polymerase subunit rpo7 [Squirrelpox virus]CCD83232.1 DNA-directed RNA polymerase subunit rpo7 [Squirrelpox virus]
MVYQLVCSTCGRDLSELRFELLVKKRPLAETLKSVKSVCCRLKLSTQVEPQRNLTVQPLLDIN